MRAAGLGRRQALATVARIGLFIAILTALVGEVRRRRSDWRSSSGCRPSAPGRRAVPLGPLAEGLVRGADGQVERLRFVNIGELLPDGTLRDVRVFEFDVEMRLSEIVHAESARYAPPDAWRLAGVDATRFVETRVGSDAPVLRAEQPPPPSGSGRAT